MTPPAGVAARSFSHCATERVAHARWCNSTFFDYRAQPTPYYIYRYIDWKWWACFAWLLHFLGLNSLGFFFWPHLKSFVCETFVATAEISLHGSSPLQLASRTPWICLNASSNSSSIIDSVHQGMIFAAETSNNFCYNHLSLHSSRRDMIQH
ncbi:hypothetical protein TNCV_44731 [Trichonephila clavipes]|nr:hypothetical protein TNCV_44731 [Trichonephila clavipes]